LATDLNQRFQDWSRIVEARFGAWPLWKKLVIFMPVLIVLSMILVAFIGLVGSGFQFLFHH
jgi:uncharacterized protein (DUF983 family)